MVGNWNRTRVVIAHGCGCRRVGPFVASDGDRGSDFNADYCWISMNGRRASVDARISVKGALGVVVLMISTSGFAQAAGAANGGGDDAASGSCTYGHDDRGGGPKAGEGRSLRAWQDEASDQQ